MAVVPLTHVFCASVKRYSTVTVFRIRQFSQSKADCVSCLREDLGVILLELLRFRCKTLFKSKPWRINLRITANIIPRMRHQIVHEQFLATNVNCEMRRRAQVFYFLYCINNTIVMARYVAKNDYQRISLKNVI